MPIGDLLEFGFGILTRLVIRRLRELQFFSGIIGNTIPETIAAGERSQTELKSSVCWDMETMLGMPPRDGTAPTAVLDRGLPRNDQRQDYLRSTLAHAKAAKAGDRAEILPLVRGTVSI